MSITLTPLEFNTFFIITIILIIFKFIVALYLGFKLYQRKQEEGKFNFGFIFSVFIMMLCLFFSRIFFFMFDFFLTELDPTHYYLIPNVYFWKVAMLIMAIGYASVLFVIDRRIIDFKFKGALAYIVIIVASIILFYQVSNSQDFELISLISFGINIIAITIPMLFLYIAYNSLEYRRPAIILSLGVIIYAIGANILNEAVLSLLEGAIGDIRIIIYFAALLLKISGLVLYSYGVTEFTVIFSA